MLSRGMLNIIDWTHYSTLPEGFTSGTLEESDSYQVSENWPAYPWPEEAVQYVLQMFKFFPTIAIRDDHRNLVAWSFTHIDATIGNLFVIEKHRKKGIGAFVLTEIARKLATTYGYALSNIVWDNKDSFKLHEKCGFKLASDLGYRLMLPVSQV